ncbi:MAG: amidohydrolase family protein [Thermoguttaceae bacterium]
MTTIIDGYCTLGTERETRLSPEMLLSWMDKAGVSKAVIAPEDREIAVENAQGNDRILELSRLSKGRFIPACTVNPWFGPAGCQELRRAVATGARMLVLAPALQGFIANDELTSGLLQTAGQLDVPVYVHTGQHSSAAPTQVVLLAARHPETTFVLGHCGSTDYAHDMPAVLRSATKNLWFEASLARPWAVGAYTAALAGRNMIFGSSAPRNDPAFELKHLTRYLPLDEYPNVYGGNLAKLLKEPL